MRVFWLLVVSVLTLSCSYGKKPITIVSGTKFPVSAARQLMPGQADTEIRALMGAPLAVSVEDGLEMWRYSFETIAGENIKFLWVIPWPAKELRGKYTATLIFRNHLLLTATVSPAEL